MRQRFLLASLKWLAWFEVAIAVALLFQHLWLASLIPSTFAAIQFFGAGLSAREARNVKLSPDEDLSAR